MKINRQRFIRPICAALAVSTLLTCYAGAADKTYKYTQYAQTAYASAEAYKSRLEEKFGFKIESDGTHFNDTTTVNGFLTQIDSVFSQIGVGFVKEMTDLFREKGVSVSLRLFNPKDGDMSETSYDVTTKTVVMSAAASYTYGSLRSQSLTHLFGHLIEDGLGYKITKAKLKNEFTAMNSGIEYGGNGFSQKVFVSDYAFMSQTQDIAETFGVMSGVSYFSSEVFETLIFDLDCGIAQKIRYLDKTLGENFKNYSGINAMGFYFPQNPSSWALAEVNDMRNQGKIPLDMEYKYLQATTRADFCELIVRTTMNWWGKTTEFGSEQRPDDYEKVVKAAYFSDVKAENGVLGIDQGYFINKAFELKIVNGVGDGSFNPGGQINRESAAKMLAEACRVMGKDIKATGQNQFKDVEKISSWAMDYTTYMQQSGIMKGDDLGNFMPQDTYTYEQTFLTIKRIG